MAKTYVGVGDTAHKVKKMYVGVDGVAKKVKKAYMGVNGVAQQVFSANTLKGLLAVGTVSDTASELPYYVGYAEESLITPEDVVNQGDGNFAVFNSLWETEKNVYPNPNYYCACVFKDKILLGGIMGNADYRQDRPFIQYADVYDDWKNVNSYTTIYVNPDVFGISRVSSMASGNGVLIATIAYGNYIQISRSTDGITWTPCETLFENTISTFETRVKFVNGLFYLFTSKGMYHSADGITWTPFSVTISKSDGNITIDNNYVTDTTLHVTNILHVNGVWYMTVKCKDHCTKQYQYMILRGDNLNSLSVVFDLYNEVDYSTSTSVNTTYIFNGELQQCNGVFWFGAFHYSLDGVTWKYYRSIYDLDQGGGISRGSNVVYFNGYYYLLTTFTGERETFYFSIITDPEDTPVWYRGKNMPYQVLDLNNY